MFWETPRNPEAPAVITADKGDYAYHELFRRADESAASLPNSRCLVFILCTNSVESVIAYLACLRHNHVALLLNRDTKEDILDRLISTYSPNYIHDPQTGFRPVAGSPPAVLHKDLALLLSTSGSTGSPKLVRLSHTNLQSNAEAISEYLNLSPSERPISVLPLYYSFGLSILNSHLACGGALLLTQESLISPSFWSFLSDKQATSLSGVPYTYQMLELLSFRKKNFPSLRYLSQAGGHLPKEMVHTYAQWAREHDIRFYVMYGQTEATARMSYLPPNLAEQHSDSIGVAIPGGHFDIDSEELIYRGANVSMGYATCRADLSKGDENQGILHTGDTARMDENGLFYITGRLKRFLKIAGNRFSLDELEARFLEQGIQAVCGGTDSRLLVAITNPEHKKTASQFLKDSWHLMKNQYEIRIVDSIPRNQAGKVLYSQLFN